MNSPDTSELPKGLRQTCDRCRRLKVRCQRGSILDTQSAGEIKNIATCDRCSRANVPCVYSCPQRSGRPPVATYGGHIWPVLKQAHRNKRQQRLQEHCSLFDLVPNTTATEVAPVNCSTPRLTPPALDIRQELQGSEAPEPWLEDSSVSSTEHYSSFHDAVQDLPGCLDLEPIQETDVSGTEAWNYYDQPCENLDLLSAVTETRFAEPDHEEEELNTCGDIRELSELSIRLHTVNVNAGVAIPCDDITDAARQLLKVINRVGMNDKRRINRNETLSTPSPSASTRSESHCFSSVQPPHGENKQGCIPDTATVMMIFACYQRLLDLFKYICLILYQQTPTTKDKDERQETCTTAAGKCDESCTPPYTNARVAMITELISHLLNQLGRGLQKLYSPQTSVNTPVLPLPLSPPSPVNYWQTMAAISGDTHKPSSGGQGHHQNSEAVSPLTTGMKNDTLHIVPCREFAGAVYAINAMVQQQQSLHAHIQIIKEFVRDSHDV